MKKLYIIDAGGLSFEIWKGVIPTGGRLNHTLSEMARDFFKEKGWEVNITYIKDPYNVDAETDKFKDADLVIYQFPLWWFSVPGKLKVFIDSIFGFGKIWTGDGRHHQDPDHNYGTGGLMNNKPYFLSVTANAPRFAFESPDDFLHGDLHAEKLLSWLDVANGFIGMKKIHSNFMCYDVVKNPTVEQYFSDYKKYLEEVYNSLENK